MTNVKDIAAQIHAVSIVKRNQVLYQAIKDGKITLRDYHNLLKVDKLQCDECGTWVDVTYKYQESYEGEPNTYVCGDCYIGKLYEYPDTKVGVDDAN